MLADGASYIPCPIQLSSPNISDSAASHKRLMPESVLEYRFYSDFSFGPSGHCNRPLSFPDWLTGSGENGGPIAPRRCSHFRSVVRFQLNRVSAILTFCRRSKILRAERFHIAVAQAIERQPCQGEFLRERSKNRFPLGLIRFPRSDVVEAFSRLLVIF